MAETAFAADFSPGQVDLHARAWVLGTVLAYHPCNFRVPPLAARVRLLAGDLPVEKAIVDLDRVDALCIAQGVVRPTEAALLCHSNPTEPAPSLTATLQQLAVLL
jgi:hypothetical protein